MLSIDPCYNMLVNKKISLKIKPDKVCRAYLLTKFVRKKSLFSGCCRFEFCCNLDHRILINKILIKDYPLGCSSLFSVIFAGILLFFAAHNVFYSRASFSIREYPVLLFRKCENSDNFVCSLCCPEFINTAFACRRKRGAGINEFMLVVEFL